MDNQSIRQEKIEKNWRSLTFSSKWKTDGDVDDDDDDRADDGAELQMLFIMYVIIKK